MLVTLLNSQILKINFSKNSFPKYQTVIPPVHKKGAKGIIWSILIFLNRSNIVKKIAAITYEIAIPKEIPRGPSQMAIIETNFESPLPNASRL